MDNTNNYENKALLIVAKKEGDQAISSANIVNYFLDVEGIDITEDLEKSEVWSQDWYFQMSQKSLDSFGVTSATIRVCGRNLEVREAPLVNLTAISGNNLTVPLIEDLAQSIQSLEGRTVAISKAGINHQTLNSVKIYCCPRDYEFLLALGSFRCRGTTVAITPCATAKVEETCGCYMTVRSVDGKSVPTGQQITSAIFNSEGISVTLQDSSVQPSTPGEGVYLCSIEDAASLRDIQQIKVKGRLFYLFFDSTKLTSVSPAASHVPSPLSFSSTSSEASSATTPVAYALPLAPPYNEDNACSAKVAAIAEMMPPKAPTASVAFLPQSSPARSKASSVSQESAGDVFRPLGHYTYHIEIFHDAENCYCPKGKDLDAPSLKENTLRAVLAAYLGNAKQADSINLLSQVDMQWNFVLHHNPANPYHPEESFVSNLRTCGANTVDPGLKADAVDTTIKAMIERYASRMGSIRRAIPGAYNNERDKYLAVLIASDKDYANELRMLALERIDTILVHNKASTNTAFISLVQTGFSIGCWEDLIEASRLTMNKEPVKTLGSDSARSPLREKGSGKLSNVASPDKSETSADDGTSIISRLLDHITCNGDVIEAKQLSRFYYKRAQNKPDFEAAYGCNGGKAKKLCADSDGTLAWIDCKEKDIGFGYIVAVKELTVVIPMSKDTFTYLRKYFKGDIESDVEAAVSDCSVEFVVGSKSGAYHIRLSHSQSVEALKAAERCVLRYVLVVRVTAAAKSFSGITVSDLETSTELETLKQTHRVATNVTAVVPNTSTDDVLRVVVAKNKLTLPKNTKPSQEAIIAAAKNYAKNYFQRQAINISSITETVSLTAVSPSTVSLCVSVPDQNMKQKALQLRDAAASLVVTDDIPSAVVSKQLNITFTYCADAVDTEADSPPVQVGEVEKFISDLCKVIRTYKLKKDYHTCLFVKDKWTHLAKLVHTEVKDVVMERKECDKTVPFDGDTIELYGASSAVETAIAILNKNLRHLHTFNQQIRTNTGQIDVLNHTLRNELKNILSKGDGKNTVYYATYYVKNKKDSYLKVIAFPKSYALWVTCTKLLASIVDTAVIEKDRPSSTIDTKAISTEFNINVTQISTSNHVDLVLCGFEERIQDAEAHILELLKGKKAESITIAVPGNNSLLSAKYFALPAMRAEMSLIRKNIKTSFQTVTATVSADGSEKIFTLRGASAELSTARNATISLLEQRLRGFVKRVISNLSPREMEWFTKNIDQFVGGSPPLLIEILNESQPLLTAAAESDSAPTAAGLAESHEFVNHICLLDGVKVIVATCDFRLVATELQCDCVVNSANTHLVNAVGIAKAIATDGGAEFAQACKDVLNESLTKSVPTGTAVIVPAFNTLLTHGFTHVVHLVSPKLPSSSTGATEVDRHALRRAITSAMDKASEAGVRRIAFPGIGTGVYNWTIQESTTLVAETISEWVATNAAFSTSICEVVLFDFSADVANGYAAALRTMEAEADSSSAAIMDSLPMGAVPKVSAPDEPTLPGIQAYWKVEAWELTPTMTPYIVTDGTFTWMPYDIDQLEQILSARSLGESTCTLLGDLAGVKNDKQYIIDLRQSKQINKETGYTRSITFKPMDANTPPPLFAERVAEYQRRFAAVSAQQQQVANRPPRATCVPYLSSYDSRPSPSVAAKTPATAANSLESQQVGILLYGSEPDVDRVAEEIQAAVENAKLRETISLANYISSTKVSFQQAVADVRDLLVGTNIEIVAADETDFSLTLDSLEKVQISLAKAAVMTHVANKISDYHKVKFPATWTTPAGDDTVEPAVIELDSNDPEYLTAASAFLTDFAATIVKIERVENRTLYGYYFLKCREIAQRNGGDANIQLLKHGTKNTDPSMIWKSGTTTNTYGFDHRFSYAATYDQMYGKGNYFAEDTKYSHDYRFRCANGDSQMFLASVAIGKVEQKASPHRSEYRSIVNPSPGFQCVRGVVREPYQGIITYELHQTYPAYLITYRSA